MSGELSKTAGGNVRIIASQRLTECILRTDRSFVQAEAFVLHFPPISAAVCEGPEWTGIYCGAESAILAVLSQGCCPFLRTSRAAL